MATGQLRNLSAQNIVDCSGEVVAPILHLNPPTFSLLMELQSIVHGIP